MDHKKHRTMVYYLQMGLVIQLLVDSDKLNVGLNMNEQIQQKLTVLNQLQLQMQLQMQLQV